MIYPIRLLHAEYIKARKDWAFLFAMLAPLTQVSTILLVLWNTSDRGIWLGAGFTNWYIVNFIAWHTVVMPVFIAIAASLSWDREDKSKAWKHLLSMPFPQGMHFYAKGGAVAVICLFSNLLLAVSLLLSGLLQRKYAPTPPMGPIQLDLLFQYFKYSLIASIPMICFHTLIASRWKNIPLNLGFALAGSWISFQFSYAKSLITLLPWGISGQVTNISFRYEIPTTSMYLKNLSIGLILLIIGFIYFQKPQNPTE